MTPTQYLAAAVAMAAFPWVLYVIARLLIKDDLED